VRLRLGRRAEEAEEIYTVKLRQIEDQKCGEHCGVQKMPWKHERAEAHELFQNPHVYGLYQALFAVR
jgi:hypothetical protein